jgi:hypothetical protein
VPDLGKRIQNALDESRILILVDQVLIGFRTKKKAGEATCRPSRS